MESVASEIAGYEVIAALAPDRTWLAGAPGGRRVVLKALDDDCLWKGQLHPNIKDRLGRVRELAHVGVANLYGVERDGPRVVMVWEYVAGQTLEELTATADDFISVARELMLSIEMLHSRGIVHGAIKPSNVIVGEEGTSGRVMLTHVSPLLYNDPAEDVRAVISMLSGLLEKRGQKDTPAGRLLARAAKRGEEPSLRQLANRLGALIDSRDAEPAGPARAQDTESTRVRRRTLMGAAATAALGLALFAGLKIYANHRTPKPPPPPQATPEALEGTLP